MLADVNTDHRTVVVDLSFLCFLGNTAPCKIISEVITFPGENAVALTKIP